MALHDDLVAARSEVTRLEGELAAARTRLADLEASVVKGGPDVSVFQGDVDWAKVAAAGYDIVFPRVADGDIEDKTFTAARVAAIKAAGLSYAPYYFGRVATSGNNQRNGRHEAALAVWTAFKNGGWGKAGDLPLVYDIENLNDQSQPKAAAHIMEFVQGYRGLMGHHPFIYTMPAFWNAVVDDFTDAQLTILAKCPLWIAHWGVSAPSVPAPWTTYTFWQTTDQAVVPGVAGKCDLNVANITKTDLDGLRIR
jgi:GH25 family lysozyme M1 (1,4-beta-N-acetylmuramidase)